MEWQILIGCSLALPSAIWLIGIVRWRLGVPLYRPNADGGISVLVAARNEESAIGDMLSSVLQQSDEKARQVVLVDDHSKDRTFEIAQGLQQEYPLLQVLSSNPTPPNTGPKKHALMQGLAVAENPLIALTDADCVVQTRWLDSMSAAMESKVGAVLGASFPPKGRRFSEFMYRAERLTANCVMASSCGWGSPSSACGHNLLYRASVLREIGGFAHPELPSGDDDLTVQAIASRGWVIRFAASPESVVEDRGGSGRASRWQSAARHQSVLRFYPVRWRALFAWSVGAHSAVLLSPFLLLTDISASGTLFGSGVLLALDAAAGMIVASKLQLKISSTEIFRGILMLPLWSVWRAASVALGTKFTWAGRTYSQTSVSSVRA